MTRTTAITATATAKAHLDAFGPLSASLPGARLDGLAALRSEALARFSEMGLPTRRIEEWKFTGLDALARKAFAPEAPADDQIALPGDLLNRLCPLTDAHLLVFVNGVAQGYGGELDAKPGVTVRALGDGLARPGALDLLARGDNRHGALVALNAAFMAGGAVIDFDADAGLDRPIVLVHLTSGDGAAAHSRHVIRLGERSRATVIEIFATLPGAVPAFSNAVTDIDIAPGAVLRHARIAAEDTGALHHALAAVRIGRDAAYDSFTLSVGGDLTRQESDVAFTGVGGKLRLYGAYLARDRQHMDHTTRVRHDHPGCVTEEHFKGAMDDHGHGVFQGLIHVAPHAVRTDARQRNVNLLLSDRAVADSKPELEIFADDVKCSHGATVGDIDPEEMFYLRARGIAPDDARRLLLQGYVGELIDLVEDDAIRACVRAHAHSWLETR
jgi:Fe-S cluster assembly protein SufD